MSTSSPRENLLGERIRNRREAREMAGYVLARQVGISPSYLSLIESGAKTPSEDIAARLADALGDDPELYRGWVQADRHPDLRRQIARLMRVESYRSSPELSGRLRRGERMPNDAPGAPMTASASRRMRWFSWGADRRADSVLHEQPPEPEAGNAVEIPVLPDGADPGDDPWAVDGAGETIWLDRRMLPPEAPRPFAYRPGEAMVERVRGLVGPGDLVVLTPFGGSIEPKSIYAVRYEERVVLSRVVTHGSILLLLPSDESGRPASIECADETELCGRLAGVVVAALRTWAQPEGRPPGGTPFAEAYPVSPMRSRPPGRTASVEGDFLVRDTEWRERYGWRPVQRPEDLEWLERHPGTRIRYRLIRDGRVRWLLEMTPAEWRRTLGTYGRSESWQRNGYIVAITQRRTGEYTEEFQDRWAPFVRRPAPGEERV